ncbi:MAG: BatD family protein [Bacteroidetes bacterium]|nr:BatD family protein [Bacteroidota bacterium]
MKIRIGIFLLGCLFATTLLQGQAKTGIQVTADKNKILIGEQLQLRIELRNNAVSQETLPVLDSIPHFEIVGKPVIDTQDGKPVRVVYTLTSFDSGHWVIPSFSLAEGMQTDTIPVDVVFSDFDPKQPYHDITDVADVPVTKKKTAWWMLAAATLLVLLLFYFLFRKKQKPVQAPVLPARPEDIFGDAMKQLDQLDGSTLLPKAYYSELTDIFRLYIFRRKGILSLQKTTDDLVVQLRSLGMEKDAFDTLSQALRMSDYVKFAKYIPETADQVKSLTDIRQALIHIEQTERNKNGQTNSKQA